ncbi:MAG: transglutaminase domain-containing protein [Gammaproteobacteria bacterium]|nr:transglutaminase domain-containing protein [Gammaproteobacteria bacterium]
MSSARPMLPAAPPLLVGAGLLLWGWQNGYLLYALAMALILEGARWIGWRWPVNDREFNNASDLSSVILIISVLYIFNEHGAKGIFTVLAIMPFVVFPLLLVQTFSLAGHVRLSALFMSLRKLDPARHPEAALPVDLTLPYFLVCFLAASAGNHTPDAFLAVAALLLAWLLWAIRPRRFPAGMWLPLVVLTLALGFGVQQGLVWLQYRVEGYTLEVMDRFLWRFRDPDLATTAIGSIGRIKLSDRIVLRIKTGAPLPGMLLLREAAYDTYVYGVWSNQKPPFTVIDPDVSRTRWELSREPSDATLAISTYMGKDAAVVPLPHGATAIRLVAATEITRNPLGAVKMEIRQGWVRYVADYNTRSPAADAPPTEKDLEISDSYREVFEDLATRLGLKGKDPAAAAAHVRAFFADGFTYSLAQRHRYPRGRYLAEFLNNTRSGHCEYFATSTVLLLRAAGIPARYALGYGIDEYSMLERQYIGRARHAHSWALAYVNGAWHALDTTPSVWAPEEAEQASTLQPLFDLWSWISYRLARTQAEEVAEAERDNTFMLWLLPPLLLALAWRLYFKERVARSRDARPGPVRGPGTDSELYAVVAALEKQGALRQPGESLHRWLLRRQKIFDGTPLAPALALHARYRFDPAGLNVAERRLLAEHAAALLQQLRRTADDRPIT